MALYTTIATGNWNADAATVWDLGAEPGPTDTFLINHDVTKDDDKGGTADAAGGTIASGKTLTLGASGTLKVAGNTTISGILDINTRTANISAGGLYGSGEIRIGALGFLYAAYGSNASIKFTMIGTDASNMATFHLLGDYYLFGGTGSTFSWAKFTSTAKAYSLLLYNLNTNLLFDNCDFTSLNIAVNVNSGGVNRRARFRNCYLYGNTYGCINYVTGTVMHFEGCVFGEDRAATPSANSGYDVSAQNGDLVFYACKFSSSTFTSYGTTGLRSIGHNQSPGEWQYRVGSNIVQRSTAAKKSGDYGIELTPGGSAATIPVVCELFIPVNTGDTVAPSIYYKNVTADLDLEAAAGRLVFELDPGDEWGLNETHDASEYSDSYNNWRQVTFTGGTAGGSSDKGTVLLRVTLARYVATGVVYLADPNFDSELFSTGSLYGPVVVAAAGSSGGGLKLVGCGGLAG